MFGVFARIIVSLLCVILFNVSGTIATASQEMTAEKFCGKAKYTVHGKDGIGPNGRSAERRNLSELASNIDRYIGANIRIEGHFFLNPSAKSDDTKFFLEGKVGPIATCVFNENETYATASHGKMVPAIVFAEDFPPIPYGFNKIKKNIFRDTHGMKSRNPYYIRGRISEWDGTPYIHVTQLVTNTIEWTPEQLKQVETQSSPIDEMEKAAANKEMTKDRFCDDGHYFIHRNGKGAGYNLSLKYLHLHIHRFIGAEIDVYGHFFPWNPVKKRGDWFDGQVGPIGTCVFDENRTWALGSDDNSELVPVEVYKENFSLVTEGYENIKKMVIHNTDEIASRNFFRIKGTILTSPENGVPVIYVTGLRHAEGWQPYPVTKKKITREQFDLFHKLSPEQQQNLIDEALGRNN